MGRFPFGDEEGNNHDVTRSPGGEVAIYEQRGGRVRLEVRLEGETLWLSLAQMADLFGRDKSVIGKHLRNVFATGELKRKAVAAKNASTAADGKTYEVEPFNLDAVLSVGYRVNSKRGTQFRIWATRTLREHLLRGYTLKEPVRRLPGVCASNCCMSRSAGPGTASPFARIRSHNARTMGAASRESARVP